MAAVVVVTVVPTAGNNYFFIFARPLLGRAKLSVKLKGYVKSLTQ